MEAIILFLFVRTLKTRSNSYGNLLGGYELYE